MNVEAISSAPSRRYQRYVIITLMIGYLFAFLDRTMIGLMVAPIQADLDISDTKMSLLMGLAFTILYSIAGVPMGLIADRWNRVRIIKYGAVIWCVMTAACGLSASYWQLFAARVFVGLGEATLMPSANSLISDYFKPHERGKAISVFNLGIAGGAGLSLILGGQLIAILTASGGIKLGLPIIDSLAPWQIHLRFSGTERSGVCGSDVGCQRTRQNRSHVDRCPMDDTTDIGIFPPEPQILCGHLCDDDNAVHRYIRCVGVDADLFYQGPWLVASRCRSVFWCGFARGQRCRNDLQRLVDRPPTGAR